MAKQLMLLLLLLACYGVGISQSSMYSSVRLADNEQGNALICLLDKDTSAIEGLIKKFNLRLYDWWTGPKFICPNDKQPAIEFSLSRETGKIKSIDIYGHFFLGKLPFGVINTEPRDTTLSKLGAYPLDHPSGDVYVYYGNLKIKTNRVYLNNGGTQFFCSIEAIDKDKPVCIDDTTIIPIQVGCIKGDCLNGYGRSRYTCCSRGAAWEYEGNYKNGLPDGDGCRISEGNYYFHEYREGKELFEVKARICVDGRCAEPKQAEEAIADTNTAHNTTTSDFKIKSYQYPQTKSDVNSTINPPKTELDKTNKLVNEQKTKMKAAGWTLIKQKDYSYQFNSLWQDVYFTTKAWRDYRAQVITSSSAPKTLEFDFALPGQKAVDLHKTQNPFPGTIHYSNSSGNYSGGMLFWWQATGYMVNTPITVLIWEK